MGLDIGAKSVELFSKELEGAKTVVWNDLWEYLK